MHLQGRLQGQGSLNNDLFSQLNIASFLDARGLKICQMDAKKECSDRHNVTLSTANNLWKRFASFPEAPKEVTRNIICSVLSRTWYPVWSSHSSVSNPIAVHFQWNCRDCCQILLFKMQYVCYLICISKCCPFRLGSRTMGFVIISLLP